LEEHSHCEVPAGCGGVVLRWLNPNQGIPLQVWLYAAGKPEFFLDGIKPASGRPLIPWGQHVWGITISEINPEYAVFSFAAFYGGKETHIKSTGASTYPVSILSAADGSWKYSLTEPDNADWATLSFDDSSWEPTIPREINPAALEKTSRDAYRIRKLQELDAMPLGISQTGSKVWLRRVFDLKPEGTST